jgi:hypothetical protein
MTAADKPPCTVDGCTRTQVARGWCSTHYARHRRNGTLDTVHRNTETVVRCKVDGCQDIATVRRMCQMHYARQMRGSRNASLPGRVIGATLDEAIARQIVAVDGHDVWQGPVTSNNDVPIVRWSASAYSVRRHLWQVEHGLELATHDVVAPTCDEPRCVTIGHMHLTTRAALRHPVTSR